MRLIAIALELVGVIGIGIGIGVEIIVGAHIGLVAITIGSCLVATGGVIWGKFLRPEQEQEGRK